MDFALTEEQTAIRDMARDFGRERIAPHAQCLGGGRRHPRATSSPRRAPSASRRCTSPRSWAAPASAVSTPSLVFEALAEACPAVSSFISIHNMCAWMIATLGHRGRPRAPTFPAPPRSTTICAYCLTEPGSGSDAAALRTRATRSNEGWTLDGTKAFISGGGFADLYLVMARTGGDGPKGISALLVEAGSPGLSFGAQETQDGLEGAADRPGPARRLPGAGRRTCSAPRATASRYAMAGLDGGRLNIAAAALGGAQAALDKALAYTGERRAFGHTLDKFQALQFRLADMETELQAARIFLYQAAWKLDGKAPDATKHCAMAKRLVTDTAFRVANDALQLLGGYGYLADYGIEKIVRDLRVHQILEGTNEIMRVIIARALLAERP